MAFIYNNGMTMGDAPAFAVVPNSGLTGYIGGVDNAISWRGQILVGKKNIRAFGSWGAPDRANEKLLAHSLLQLFTRAKVNVI